jgi:hypothetical protein
MEMALRSKAQIAAFLMVLPLQFPVRHRHIRNGAEGVMRVTNDSLVFEEPGKHSADSRTWKFEDIRMLTLSEGELRVQTYEDQKWQPGRDREFVFEGLPKGVAEQLYGMFRERLDQRFVAALADKDVQAEWQAPAKLLHLRRGSQGEVLVGRDLVVYRSVAEGESRTWRIGDIEAVSSSGPFDLTVTTHEKEFRFELKRALPEARYQALWRVVNRAQGLQILNGEDHE